MRRLAPLDHELHRYAVRRLESDSHALSAPARPTAVPASPSPCATCARGNGLRAPRGLGLTLPNATNSPDLVMCGAGGVAIGADVGAASGLARLHDLLVHTLAGHGRSGYLCYRPPL